MLFTPLAVIDNPVLSPQLGTGGAGGQPLTLLLATALRMLLIAGGILLLFFIIIAGINWLTAEGKPDVVEKSRNMLINAITGFVIIVGAIALTSFIGNALNIEFLKTLNISLPALGQ